MNKKTKMPSNLTQEKMNDFSYIIGIDPDNCKSGIAIHNPKEKYLETKSLSFFELFDYLRENKENIKLIKIEGGWLNKKSNFRFAKSQSIGEKMARDVGANHETGKKIIEMCEYLNIEYKVVKPLQKNWRGSGKKITDVELRRILFGMGITFNQKRTNQDNRDSVLICLF